MSFKENAYQQLSFADSCFGLTAREQKALEKSWAKVFADEILPAIDEKRFSVLYSDKASRPDTPVNVIVGALILASGQRGATNLKMSLYIFCLQHVYICNIMKKRGGAPMEMPILKIKPKKYTEESTVVSMRMPCDMVREIDGIASATGYTRTELMMLCLEFSLDHMEIIQKQIKEEK